jgi:ribosomal protein S18 acetylase RimI-like enzyme
MATSDLIFATKPLFSADELAAAEALVREANWNQLAADWHMFIARGHVYAAQTTDGRIVATTATLPFDGGFAWISMVLVTGEQRRRGLATQLLRLAMADLAAARLVPVLDATPDGRAVYRRLGFQDSWEFQRYRRAERRAGAPPALAADVTIAPIADQDWAEACAYDAAAFGAAREPLLADLCKRMPPAALVARRNGRIVGLLLGRDGRIAAQLGPLIAHDDAVACALLCQAIDALDGPLFVDLADAKLQVRAFIEARGFNAVRPFTRMLYGRSTRFDDAARTFAVVGPEFG